MILIILFIPSCMSNVPYLLRSYPSNSVVMRSSFTHGPCLESIKSLSFFQHNDNISLNHTVCFYNVNESILTCKLGLQHSTLSMDLETYPINHINVVVVFAQEFLENIRTRVLDLCFLKRFGTKLKELAICGYRSQTISKSLTPTYLPILDIPTLAIAASKIQTLLISGVHIWQSVELRQFKSLKHFLLLHNHIVQMKFYHSPHCADCESAHPPVDFSFHYLIPLSSQLTYFLYDSSYIYKSCAYDLLKEIKSKISSISTFVVASSAFYNDLNNPICNTCASGLCPLLAVCLDENSNVRRKKDEPFECLCVEELKLEDEFKSCDPMSIHQPMYSTRCNNIPSFWNYITRSMIIVASYVLFSIMIFIVSTVFLIRSK